MKGRMRYFRAVYGRWSPKDTELEIMVIKYIQIVVLLGETRTFLADSWLDNLVWGQNTVGKLHFQVMPIGGRNT
jgi:hypothetical protein